MFGRSLSRSRTLTVSTQERRNVIQLFLDRLCVAKNERPVSVASRFCRYRPLGPGRDGGPYVALPRLLSETGRDLEQERLFLKHLQDGWMT